MRIAGNTEKPNVGTEYNGIYIAPGVELPAEDLNISTVEKEDGKYVVSVKKIKTLKKRVTVRRKRLVYSGKQSHNGVQTSVSLFASLKTSLAGMIVSSVGFIFLRKKRNNDI